MLILAFDTATDLATSALVADGVILGERTTRPQSLLADVDALLAAAGAIPETPSAAYSIWVHSNNAGGYSSAVATSLTCTPAPVCTAQNFCSGNNLMHRDAACNDTLVQACTYGCNSGAGVCNPTPAPSVSLTVNPILVSSGTQVRVVWSSTFSNSCTVTENNPNITDTWSGLSGSQTSSRITEQTVYTLSCVGANGSTVTATKIVNIIPVWQEK